MAKISVIIPAYKRHELTVRVVEETMKSNRVPDELIVVNDGGDPSLREMLLALPRKMEIIYARVTEDIIWNYNGACNLGFWISTGDYFILQDTDHIPDRDAIGKGENILNSRSEVDRVAFYRKVVPITEVMSKPMEEWSFNRTWGGNQMVAMLRRDTYLQLKGQDERFVGNYGYMAMDFQNRRDNMYHSKSVVAHYYWAVVEDGGEPGMKRSMSPINRKFYKENSLRKDWQHPNGILNFNYTIERLKPNV